MRRIMALATALLCSWINLNTAYANGLSINDTIIVRDTIEGCDHYTWSVSDSTYLQSGSDTVFAPDAAGVLDTLYVLNLTIHSIRTGSYDATVCDEFQWKGKFYYSTTTFKDTIPAPSRGLCDSILTVKLKVNHSVRVDLNRDVCNVFQWKGQNYYDDTILVERKPFAAPNGCDSIIAINLAVRHSGQSVAEISACDEYLLDNVSYHSDTTFSTVLVNASENGCDSIASVNLTVRHSGYSTSNMSVCDKYVWGGQEYTNDTTLHEVLANASQDGCDSIVTINLSVRHSGYSTNNMSVCDEYVWGGQEYTNDTTLHEVLSNASQDGCDSIITINLSVRHSGHSTSNMSVCDKYVWDGQEYTNDTTLYEVLANASQDECDSIVTINLSVRHSGYSTDSMTVCDEYLRGGLVYTNDTTLYEVLANASHEGCDSTVTIQLSVIPSVLMENDTSVCDEFRWEGHSYFSDATLSKTIQRSPLDGCDSTVIINLAVRYSGHYTIDTTVCDIFQWKERNYNSSVTFTDTLIGASDQHCDSTETVRLVVRYSTGRTVDTSACELFQWKETIYTNDVLFVDTLANSVQCDSVVEVNLAVHRKLLVLRWNDVIAVNNNTVSGAFAHYDWTRDGVSILCDKPYYHELDLEHEHIYSVVAIKANGDSVTSCEYLFEPTPTSAAVAMPNPTCNYTNISGGQWNMGDGIIICDMTGRVLRTVVASGNGSAAVDMNGMAPGLYFVKAGDEVIKIVKQ